VPPRRGVGGGGASSFAPQEQAAPQTPVATAAADADVRPLPSPKANGLAANAESHASHAPAAADNGAARAASSSANLKLVPPPAQGYGGAPSFARDAASRASEAPFPLADGAGSNSNFFDSLPAADAPRAGEDRVGRPVSLVPPASAEESARVTATQESAPSPYDDAGAYEEADSLANRIGRGLEARGKHLLAGALEGARRVIVDGDGVRVEFTPESKQYEALKKSESQKLLREVCCEVLGRAVGVAVTDKAKADGGEEATPEDEARREKRLMRERAEGHPAVQQLLKTFRAEIVEVRPTTDTQAQ